MVQSTANGDVATNQKEFEMSRQSEIDEAKRYFYSCYLNTGCDEDEAVDHTEFVWSQCGGVIDRLYFEAERYRDM